MIPCDLPSQIFEKKLVTEIWAQRSQIRHKMSFFFCRFIEIGSYVFLKISYNDNLQQCLTSSRGKTQEKILGVQIWTKRAKIAPVITFFAIFSSLLQVYIIFSRYCT